jgi:hypothetical protein
VGAASGRVDAAAFMVGLIVGVLVFAEVYVAVAGFLVTGEIGAVTFADILGVPFWALAAVVVLLALGTFWLLDKLERPGAPRERKAP